MVNDSFWQYWVPDSDDAPLDLTDPRGPVLSGDTLDHVAIDSLKWHYSNLDPADPELLGAFRRVLSYYGVNIG
ncbi:hypothetical protein UFOVP346_14 [uncultured Caudovirales phage]|uniref:Uncharacterized protein n=1 Tax=uncultured Caudovirales phage TaxID=2100421 RepID=A0A6J5M5C9_9CAUD|nr:hypothetical protein UFOVP346_14 [uncultured Caudovirales phage]